MSTLTINLRQQVTPSSIINAGYTAVFFGLQLKIAINFAFFHQLTLETLFLYLIAFKLGEFVNEVSYFGRTRLWVFISVLSIIAATFGSIPLAAIGYFFFGLSMMRVRDIAALSSPRVIKYSARAFGFVVAPLIPDSVLVILLIVSATVAYIKSAELPHRPSFRVTWPQQTNLFVYVIMMLHHAHYFAYAYAIPFIFAERTSLSPQLMGLVFYSGWAAYNAYEWYLKPRWMWLILGHILAALALLLVPIATTTVSLLTLWFITGLGGGTVYMLRDLLALQTKQSHQELKIAEGLGHLLGISIWFLAMLAQPDTAPFISACALGVLATIFCIGANQRKPGAP